jgi:hypothetical protein
VAASDASVGRIYPATTLAPTGLLRIVATGTATSMLLTYDLNHYGSIDEIVAFR